MAFFFQRQSPPNIPTSNNPGCYMNISLVVKEEKEELGGIIVPYPPTRISLVSISANGKSIVFYPISSFEHACHRRSVHAEL